MFDTMTFTKVLGGFCGTFLIFLLAKWGAEELYHMGGHGHGDHGAQQAYLIEVDSGEETAAEEETVDIAALVAEADVAKGEKVFSKCKACHKLEDGANGTGPHLFGVVNRGVGAIDGFGYSGVMAELGGEWGYEELDGFLENPKGYVSGTKMAFSGLKKQKDRANLIAYLETIQ